MERSEKKRLVTDMLKSLEYPLPDYLADLGLSASRGVALMSTQDTMMYLGISRQTLWRITKAGKIPTVRIGDKPMYRVRDLEAFIESLTAAPEDSESVA